ncbi:protein translocase subunit SecF [Ethanoligenens harbinense]|uniref:Protein-export membrane protein SecF n=1 Tax=Ethanoligenens harbinense (strain DSM 18485 / JCM 12961 / CGMCC 1.5033 / YUAN-3) TaxID=663278 RepID=E6U7Q5_ETHHY|nr:protein translocase subunit SecF [Ethanoligenens harbinense]ADU28178.1 protein-export membrane protein SecF [Ethanoligenens harbinense YUAN-3]AVQ97181.1 protein translocase subunit SecF [Ethanoligenens harbinense YUAN-3]AYF39844.1 protein translocase subunit SecF [Ethanoligenens harbinense]AYF42676.1 protein translocase subunit SecF [Ethanoligenens harbinense]QCN93425.1 protein translocase subunit SecF [Ethanoligenens harbinense]
MSDKHRKDNVTPLFGHKKNEPKVRESQIDVPDEPAAQPKQDIGRRHHGTAPTIMDMDSGRRSVQPDQQAGSDAEEKGEVYNGLHIDFIGKRRVFYTISISLIVIGILVSAIFGVKLDIQFKGGAIIQYSYTGTLDLSTAQTLANKTIAGGDFTVQVDKVPASHTQLLVLQTTKALTNTQQASLYNALNKQFSSNSLKKYQSNDVSPQTGRQFFLQSIGAVLLAALLIVLYVWIRFRHIGGLPAGLTALIALLHDLVIAFVAFSIFRIPISDSFVAVALTILGYSINDTIVVYDRIRENRGLFGRSMKFKDIVNRSINQSFTRSINTTLVTFLAIATVCVFSIIFHLDSIRGFALPMMVGVVTGCYSTICIAGPLWVSWVEHQEKKDQRRAGDVVEG